MVNKRKNKVIKDGNPTNLGLDADGSSDVSSLNDRFNNDNDRISGNPEGEEDEDKRNISLDSPLEDK